MKFDTGSFPRNALGAALAGVIALGLAACDQQQKTPPSQFGENLEILPGHSAKSASSGAAPRSPVSVDIPDPGDAALASKVKAVLSAEPALKSVMVEVVAIDGVVTLNGTADTHATSDRAARTALDVDGVHSVKNEIVIVRGS
jgi:hypothetical protein